MNSIKNVILEITDNEITLSKGYDIDDLNNIDKKLNFVIPQQLKELYCTAGNTHIFTHDYLHLIKPENLYVKNGKLVFLQESQTSCVWGTEPDGKLFQYKETTNTWEEENSNLNYFIHLLVYFKFMQAGLDNKNLNYFKYCGAICRTELLKNNLSEQFNKEISGWEKQAEYNSLYVHYKHKSLLWRFKSDENSDSIILVSKSPEMLNDFIKTYGFLEL